MILTAVALLALQDPLPALGAGSNAPFYRTYYGVQRHLEAKEFDEAAALAAKLPRREITFRWDDSKLSPARRAEFAEAREMAFKAWEPGGLKLSFKPSTHPDLLFTFERSLPPNPDSVGPAAAVNFFSEAAEDPRLEVVLAELRGADETPSMRSDIFNEVVHAIGQFLGLQRSPLPGTASYRSDAPNGPAIRPSGAEFGQVRSNVEAAEALAKAVGKREVQPAAVPSMRILPEEVLLDPVNQGDPVRFSIQVSNTGTGPLAVNIRPDCGCLTGHIPDWIAPDASGLIEAQIDTREFVGSLHKRFLVFSNDPEAPYRAVSIKIVVRPLFRLIAPEGTQVVVDPGKPKVVDAYLFSNGGDAPNPLDARVLGIPAAVAMEPWEGDLADPEMGEPARPRKGYRFRLRYAGEPVPGRSASTLMIRTDSTQYPQLRLGFLVQSGIVALPQSIYFGEITKEPRQAAALLTRPGRPFTVTAVESDNPHITATVGAGNDPSQLRVVVKFDGRADIGQFRAVVRLKTDDPKQPEIVLPVQAVVK